MKYSKYFIIYIFLLFSNTLFAIDVYVSPKGNDLNNGTVLSPKATINSALRYVREIRRINNNNLNESINIHLMNGVHKIYESILLRPEDSGTVNSPTLIIGEEGSSISSGVSINNWKKNGKYWTADVPLFNGRPFEFRQLWINGVKAQRARDVQNFDDMFRILKYDVTNKLIWVPSKSITKILHSKYAEMNLLSEWTINILRIKSIIPRGDSAGISFYNPENRIQFEHPAPQPFDGRANFYAPFYLSNAKELLDSPGEWYYDIDYHKLYYYPHKNDLINKNEFIVPTVETLVRVEGSLDNPVKNIIFKNINFNYSSWIKPSKEGYVPLQSGLSIVDGYSLNPKMSRNYDNSLLNNHEWLKRGGSAIKIINSNNIDFIGCTFEHIGNHALDYVIGDNGGNVERCIFKDVSGNGIVAGSFAPNGMEAHLAYNPNDKRNVCQFQMIKNSIFTDIANEDWGCVAICAGYVSDITIENNEIFDVSYSGISLGWGWTKEISCMKNNIIRRNYIHDFGKHLYDCGGIYTLSAQPNSKIEENVIEHIYRPTYVHLPKFAWYIYLDEGTSGFLIKDNWTEKEYYSKHANGIGNLWINNGPNVNDSIRTNAGIH